LRKLSEKFFLHVKISGYNHLMKPTEHIKNALKDLDAEVESILLNISLSLTEKDNFILPLLQQKRVLSQTLQDLEYLEAHPPTPNQPCGISKYRDD
jgi:hypothetical protein